MRVLDLFSGIGAFSLGLERAGMLTIGFCEIDSYCRAVLRQHWPCVPCAHDIRTTHFERGEADVIAAGFPCQDVSFANVTGKGLAGSRSGLWRECARAISEVRPKLALLENVTALLDRGLGGVLGDLAALGYDAEWHCVSAAHLGAAHRRDRVWIVAYARGSRWERPEPYQRVFGSEIETFTQHDDSLAGAWRALDEDHSASGKGNGAALWLERERLHALGNSLVPQIAEAIGRTIMRVPA